MNKRSPERTAWLNLRRYGAVHPSWSGSDGFERFLADVGRRPSPKHQLHRPDVSKPAAPDNFAWIVRGKDKMPAEGRGRYSHGMCKSPTWNSWIAMRQRCYSESSPRYAIYGGRGIRVCVRWLHSFENFLADMGERPSGMSLDRINVDGDYEPGNCRWATAAQQNQNKRNSKLESHEPAQIRWLYSLGYTQTEIAKFFELDQTMVSLLVRGKIWKEEAQ